MKVLGNSRKFNLLSRFTRRNWLRGLRSLFERILSKFLGCKRSGFNFLIGNVSCQLLAYTLKFFIEYNFWYQFYTDFVLMVYATVISIIFVKEFFKNCISLCIKIYYSDKFKCFFVSLRINELINSFKHSIGTSV
jgi:hypothetical protein